MTFINGIAIGRKLPALNIMLVATTIIIMTAANLFLMTDVIKLNATKKLENAAHANAARVKTMLETIDRNVRAQARAPFTAQALIALNDGYRALEDRETKLREVYITDNPHPAGERDLLVKADTGSSYGFIHAVYHPIFDALQDDMGYYDVFLFAPNGDLVYSVFKEDDFATNMMDGPWSESGLAQAFKAANVRTASDTTVFIDFSPYEPSAFAPAAFAARPVFDAQGQQLGVVAIQMPIELLNAAAGDLDGLGDMADGFVVGTDGLMRTDSTLTEADDILTTKVTNDAVLSAFSEGPVSFTGPGTLGQEVMGYSNPILFAGLEWTLVVQQDVDVLFSGVGWVTWRSMTIALAFFGVAIVISFLFARSISGPLHRLTKSVNLVADGVLDEALPETDRGDEIGTLAKAAEVFRQNALKMEALHAEQQEAQAKMTQMHADQEDAAKREKELLLEREKAERETAQARQEMMEQLGASFGDVVTKAIAGNFDARIKTSFDDEILVGLAENINTLMTAMNDGLTNTGHALARVAAGDLTQRMEGDFSGAFADLQDNVNTMIGALTELAGDISDSGATLEGSSDELRQTADKLSRQAEQNAAAVEETSAALEELSVSLKSVSVNVEEVSQSANQARKTAETSEGIAAEAATSMDRIAQGSDEIARVTEVINDIAFQINLLALNAGVEAARAGEAGLGFSVVASEVRQLAQRASDASTEISEVIKQSNLAVGEGVEKVASAKSSLEGIAKSVVKISQSVSEVTTAISEQSSGLEEINTAISQIDSNTQKQAASFEEVTASGHTLARQARELRETTSRFKVDATLSDDLEVIPPQEAAA